MISVIALLYYFIALSYLFIFSRGRMFLNPAALWIWGQIIFFTGTLFLINHERSSDIINILITFVGLLFFIFGASILRVMVPITKKESQNWYRRKVEINDTNISSIIIWALVLISMIIGILYYRAVGYNVFIESFQSYFVKGQGLISNVATLRLDAYSTGRYLAPGYVNQFKNIIFPLLVAYLIIDRALTQRDKLGTIVLTVILFPVTIILLLGTGQRGAFFIIFLIISSFIYISLPHTIAKKWLLLFGATFIVLFSLATFFLGRSEYGSFTNVSTFFQLIQEIFKRFFVDNQMANIIGFRYVYLSPIQYGQEWMKGLLQLLPGRLDQPMLANIVFSILSGGLRGTAPVSIWSETWYNWGPIGVPVIGFILGWSYQYIYHRLIRGPKEFFRLLIYSAVYIILGLWAVSGPTYLINNGLVTVLFLYFLITTSRKSYYKKIRPPIMANEIRPVHE